MLLSKSDKDERLLVSRRFWVEIGNSGASSSVAPWRTQVFDSLVAMWDTCKNTRTIWYRLKNGLRTGHHGAKWNVSNMGPKLVQFPADFTGEPRCRLESKAYVESVKTCEEYDATLKIRRRSKLACVKANLGQNMQIGSHFGGTLKDTSSWESS